MINIVPIPKSGDIRFGSNYRGISFISLVAKVYNKMILNRIWQMLDPYLRPIQNGFRTGRRKTTGSQENARLSKDIQGANFVTQPNQILLPLPCKYTPWLPKIMTYQAAQAAVLSRRNKL